MFSFLSSRQHEYTLIGTHGRRKPTRTRKFITATTALILILLVIVSFSVASTLRGPAHGVITIPKRPGGELAVAAAEISNPNDGAIIVQLEDTQQKTESAWSTTVATTSVTSAASTTVSSSINATASVKAGSPSSVAAESATSIPIIALSYSLSPGPKTCRGHLIHNLHVPPPSSQWKTGACVTLPGNRHAECGIFYASKDDKCEARLYAVEDCKEGTETYMNTAVFTEEMTPVGGMWKSMLVRCGVEAPPVMVLDAMSLGLDVKPKPG